ncbi:MAG: amino acid transporter [Burkholderiales bacterium]|jgi:amino acid transporter|nr:MAG: amino acid transporter [Burkholderiales bacterium]
MATESPTAPRGGLRLHALVATAVGVVVVQSTMISMLNGAGLGALNYLVAIGLAALLAASYVLSFAELSLMLPRAGSVSAYTQAAIGPGPAIIAALSGYVAVAMLGIPAELILVDALAAQLAPGLSNAVGQPSLLLLAAFCLLNLRGIDAFARLQSVLVTVMFVGILVIGLSGALSGNVGAVVAAQPFEPAAALSLVALAIWGLVGLEFVCPMIGEAHDPKRDVPRAMFIGLVLIVAAYGLYCVAGLAMLGPEALGSATPHVELALAIFGEPARIGFALLAILGSATLLNTVLASVSRMVQGMAQSGQLPALFARENRAGAPAPALVALALGIGAVRVPLGMDAGSILSLTVAAAGCWLIAYIIVHVDHIVLRHRLPDTPRPFRSPWFPLPQLLGIIGMAYVFLNISPTPELAGPIYRNVAWMLGITCAFALFWTLAVQRRNPFRALPLEEAAPVVASPIAAASATE